MYIDWLAIKDKIDCAPSRLILDRVVSSHHCMFSPMASLSVSLILDS